MFSRSINVVAWMGSSWLLFGYSAFHCISTVQFVPQWKNIWVDFTLGWLWIMLLGTFMHKILGGHMLSALTGISLGGEMLGHVVPGLYYLNYCKTLSQITVPFSIPVSSAWGLQFLHILANPYLSFGWGMSCGYERTGNPDWAVDFLHGWLFFTSVRVLHGLWKRLRKVKHIVAI